MGIYIYEYLQRFKISLDKQKMQSILRANKGNLPQMCEHFRPFTIPSGPMLRFYSVCRCIQFE